MGRRLASLSKEERIALGAELGLFPDFDLRAFLFGGGLSVPGERGPIEPRESDPPSVDVEVAAKALGIHVGPNTDLRKLRKRVRRRLLQFVRDPRAVDARRRLRAQFCRDVGLPRRSISRGTFSLVSGVRRPGVAGTS